MYRYGLFLSFIFDKNAAIITFVYTYGCSLRPTCDKKIVLLSITFGICAHDISTQVSVVNFLLVYERESNASHWGVKVTPTDFYLEKIISYSSITIGIMNYENNSKYSHLYSDPIVSLVLGQTAL